jgi:outer membrane protein TolC
VKEVIKQGLDLANKNLSGIEKLIANQKVTKDMLYKAKSSVSNRETELRNAENNVRKSQHYFNFLLNRPIETTLDMDGIYAYEPSEKYSVRQVNESLSENEFRLSAIRYMQDATMAQKKFIHANYLPKIQLGALGAYNGQVISFDDPKRFIGQVQVSLKWNLFNSGTLKAKSKQADFQLEKLQSQYNLQQQQILLNETNAFGDVSTELQNHASIRDSYTNADVYYKAVEQKFQLGMSSILELTEAEAGLLQAGVQCQLWYYQLLVKAANYQKTTGKKIQIISQ